MTCKDAARFIYKFMDGDITDKDRVRLRKHLKDCAPCLGHYEFDLALKALVKKCGCRCRVSERFKKTVLKKIAPGF